MDLFKWLPFIFRLYFPLKTRFLHNPLTPISLATTWTRPVALNSPPPRTDKLAHSYKVQKPNTTLNQCIQYHKYVLVPTRLTLHRQSALHKPPPTTTAPHPTPLLYLRPRSSLSQPARSHLPPQPRLGMRPHTTCSFNTFAHSQKNLKMALEGWWLIHVCVVIHVLIIS